MVSPHSNRRQTKAEVYLCSLFLRILWDLVAIWDLVIKITFLSLFPDDLAHEFHLTDILPVCKA